MVNDAIFKASVRLVRTVSNAGRSPKRKTLNIVASMLNSMAPLPKTWTQSPCTSKVLSAMLVKIGEPFTLTTKSAAGKPTLPFHVVSVTGPFNAASDGVTSNISGQS